MCLKSIVNLIVESRDTLASYRETAKRKSDGSPICDADLYLNNLIEGEVSRHLPHHHIVSEETPVDQKSLDKADGCIVFVDPLDGTENFIVGYPMWAVGVSIYCEKRHAGSVIVAPELNEIEYSFATQRQKNSSQSRLIGLSSSIDVSQSAPQPNETEYRITGCSLLNLLFVSRGVFRMYENPVGANCWDILPGLHIAQSCGASEITIDGSPYDGQMLLPTKRYTVRVIR